MVQFRWLQNVGNCLYDTENKIPTVGPFEEYSELDTKYFTI